MNIWDFLLLLVVGLVLAVCLTAGLYGAICAWKANIELKDEDDYR